MRAGVSLEGGAFLFAPIESRARGKIDGGAVERSETGWGPLP